MKILLTTIALLFIAIGFATQSVAQTLVYERVYSELPAGDNIVRITLSDTGSVVIERPELMTHSGRHEFTVSPQRYTQLQQQLQSLPFDTLDLQVYLNQRSNALRYISHPEYSRFIALDATRTVHDMVEIQSLNANAQTLQGDSYLNLAVDLEESWWSLMNQLLQGDAQ